MTTSHLIASMGLRASRTVLLVPGWGNWTLMARAGIHALTTMWGGAGFVVVPVKSGGLDPALIAAVRAYDPDSILVPPAKTLVRPEDYPNLYAAQETLSKACANYRSPIVETTAAASPDAGHLWGSTFSTGGPGGLTAVAEVTSPDDWIEAIGANPALAGPIGLQAALRWGLSDPPTDELVDVAPGIRRLAIQQIVSMGNSFLLSSLEGAITRGGGAGDFRTQFHRTLFGLTGMIELGLDRPPALVVWGDDPYDFALSMAWDRTYGYGVWVPDEWWSDGDSHETLIAAIDNLASSALSREQRELRFVSMSLGDDELATRVESCRLGTERSLGAPLIDSTDDVIISVRDIEYPRYSKMHYSIRGKHADPWSTAVETNPDGSVEFAMLPPLPQIATPGLEKIEENAKWQVDVSIRNHEMPCTTAIPDQALLAEGEDVFSTRVRSTRAAGSPSNHIIPSLFLPAVRLNRRSDGPFCDIHLSLAGLKSEHPRRVWG